MLGGALQNHWFAPVALGLMGIAIPTGADQWLEARVNDWLPDVCSMSG